MKRILLPVLAATLGLGIGVRAASADPLSDGFAIPPREAHPETFFHLIGGNVSKPGLTVDLESVAHAGFKGIVLFHGKSEFGAWPGVSPQIECLSPSWNDMISHVASECRRLDLHYVMENCPGWSMSGGPWIKPDNAMRELIWSSTNVSDGAAVDIVLPVPEPSREKWRDYRDIAVIAFPTPEGDVDSTLVPAKVLSNQSGYAWKALLAGEPRISIPIAVTPMPTWVEVTFTHPVTLRSLDLPPVEKLAMKRMFDPATVVHVQAIGDSGLIEVARREIPRSNWQDNVTLTLALPETTAKGFRVTFENRRPLELSRLRFSSAARMDDWQAQAGFVLRSLDPGATPEQTPAARVPLAKIIDLGKYMQPDGRFTWQPPPGNWTVVRFGHVNSGEENGPAPEEATGFECDKLSAAGADAHFAAYIGRIAAPGGPGDNGRLSGMEVDSWECHTQTWTPAMETEFAARRGYALRQWLPALAGWIVDDPDTSERFLRDWRATIGDLVVDNYYGRLATLAHERGMTVSYESGPGDVAIGDILKYYGQADMPQCEFWQPNDPHRGGLEMKPMHPAVSAARIYGKKVVAAESFTQTRLSWDEYPFMLKHLADLHFSLGLNHLIFHTYTHNPNQDLVPGTSFGGHNGTPFIRGQTWWPTMPLWTDYISRCSFLLQQGQPVTDVLWYLGDDLDHKPRSDEPFPNGYQYDYVNSDALLHRISVADGLLKTPEGLAWKVLLLPHHPQLTAESLTRLRDLVKQGATVIGLPSARNPSLSGGEENNRRFHAALGELWGESPAASGDQRLGAGRLIWGGDLSATLAKLGHSQDVIGASAATWCHRRDNGTDIYFVAAGRSAPLDANLGFRSTGRPELWDPLTGTSRPVSVYHRLDENHTTVPITLPAAGSVFVVFRQGKGEPLYTRISRDNVTLVDAAYTAHVDQGAPNPVQGLPLGEEAQPWIDNPSPAYEMLDGGKRLLAWSAGTYRFEKDQQAVATVTAAQPRTRTVAGPWRLSFPPGWDAPAQIDLASLQPWSELADPASRSFSGSATYTCTIDLDAVAPDLRVMLDLGRVADIAGVSVNGKSAGTLWAAPFRADITPYVTRGANTIAVTVTNTWFNRLAYDAALPEAERKTWSINAPAAGTPVEPAGLIGPVVLRLGQVVDLKQ